MSKYAKLDQIVNIIQYLRNYFFTCEQKIEDYILMIIRQYKTVHSKYISAL